ncbi:MAG TPA: phosphate signaling complex protein PhoU [Candidatus Acidoferrales bacterium]
MSTTQSHPSSAALDPLVVRLEAMARLVATTLHNAIQALLEGNHQLAAEVFLCEPQVNEMEVSLDDWAVRILAKPPANESDLRLIVAAMKITNDLERMGDQAVNIAERVIARGGRKPLIGAEELPAMAAQVEEMVQSSLRALLERDVEVARRVLESDAEVDGHRDRIFQSLLATMAKDPSNLADSVHLLLASRTLERIADHATNICEDVIYWIRGLDVRHHMSR